MRMYNGCPDSELKAIIENRERLLTELRNIVPEASVCFHHPTGWYGEHGYQAHVWGRPLSGFHKSPEAALIEAINLTTNHPELPDSSPAPRRTD
jgi:hypothetical protein